MLSIDLIYSIALVGLERKMDPHDKDILDCVSTNFDKEEIITPAKIQRKCNLHFYTVENHLAHTIGVPMADGKMIRKGKFESYYKDPPSNKEDSVRDLPREMDDVRPHDPSWEDFALGALAGGLAASTLVLLALAFQPKNHTCSWVPVSGKASWVRVCETCGRQTTNLNDPNAPVHFAPLSTAS